MAISSQLTGQNEGNLEFTNNAFECEIPPIMYSYTAVCTRCSYDGKRQRNLP